MRACAGFVEARRADPCADIVKPHTLTLGIESKHSCPKTSSRALANALREALDEMRDLCARFPPPPRLDERAKVRKEMAEFLQKMKEDR